MHPSRTILSPSFPGIFLIYPITPKLAHRAGRCRQNTPKCTIFARSYGRSKITKASPSQELTPE